MTNPQTRPITFDGQQVAVRTDVPEIVARVEQHFRLMLRPDAGNPVARLDAGVEGGKYFLRDDHYWVRSGSLDDFTEYLTYEVALRHVRARPDLLWLHAGAVAGRHGAVLISGASGRGKSTLVAALCARGGRFLSDDVLPLDPVTGKVSPFPQTPMRRCHRGEEVPPGQVRRLKKTETPLDPTQVAEKPLPVAAVVFPHYTPGEPAALVPHPPGAAVLELLQNCLNFGVHRETAFHRLCELVKPLPAFRLPFQDGDEAAQALSRADAAGFRAE